MSLTSREETQKRFPHRTGLVFSVSKLAREVAEHVPEVEFAYLLGSGQHGIIPKYSDLDLAVFAKPGTEKDYTTYTRIVDAAEKALPGPVDIDVVFLNHAHCVFSFEALKGKRLFARPDCLERLAEFYSLTCREYEEYMSGIQRRHRLMKEVKSTTDLHR